MQTGAPEVELVIEPIEDPVDDVRAAASPPVAPERTEVPEPTPA